jgi:signal transduction histidine kinase
MKLTQVFSGDVGAAVYAGRSVALAMDNHPLIIDADENLDALNDRILERHLDTLLDGFIAVRDGRYVGVGAGVDVVRANAEKAVRNAAQLGAEMRRAREAERALLSVFHLADAALASNRAALSRVKVAGDWRIERELAPERLEDLLPRVSRLFEEIERSDAALVAALEAAEAANAARSLFLAKTTHELRTPLNAIIGYSEMLQEGAEERGDAQSLEDAGRVISAGKHLLGLINDILDMSKIEAGRLDIVYAPVDLGAVARDAIAAVTPQAARKGLRLTLSVDPTLDEVETDGFRIKQCLLNFLSNAVKFTERGDVALSIKRELGQHGEQIAFAVSDTGMGMSEAQMRCLFQPFRQGDASIASQFGGTGLGLAITKRLAEALNGGVHMESRKGRGSTFRLTIPARPIVVEAVVAA